MQHMQSSISIVISAFCLMVPPPPPPPLKLLPCIGKTRAHYPEMPLLASPIWDSTWQVGQGKSPYSFIASFQLLFLSWTLTGGWWVFMSIRCPPPPMTCHLCYRGPVWGVQDRYFRCSRIAPD
ncbi:hypothetical protein CGRA01v4_11957 [Colletotrichum graminicola]|nr:hypothetical protein CGRA01v4_11957 [Colletotrichum graminicola]